MPDGYSHIVVGAGTIGAAAAYWLTQRGADRVLVLEQYDLLHPYGSFSDHSRIIRRVYQSTDYVGLSDAMFEAWAHIERVSGLPVYTRTGGLDMVKVGSSGEEYMLKARQAMDEVGVPYEDLSGADIRERFPQWHIADDTSGIYQKDTGILDVRRSVSAHTSLALGAGVDFLSNTKVNGISLRQSGVSVRTSSGSFDADHLIVAAGSWLGELMSDLGLNYNLTLSQEQVSYFSSKDLAAFAPGKHPVWIHHGEDSVYYGFPVYGEAATKIARDLRGRFISSEDRVFEGDVVEGEILAEFLRKYLPAAAGPALAHKTCVYDMPPDRGFVLGSLPGHPHVSVFNGAGHAAKFGSLVGQILADLQTSGSTPHEIGAFSLDRPAITDSNYPSTFKIGTE